MTRPPQILAFAGSVRRASLNRQLLAVVADAARAAGGEVTGIELGDFALPLYDGDLEDAGGLPAAAARLVDLIARHDALLIASPEYNAQLTPLLKNTLDWCTRAEPNPFAGKVAAVVSASPGGYGGVRSTQLARQLLAHLGCHVVPAQCAVPRAHQAFDAAGKLAEAKSLKSAQRVAEELVKTASKLGGM